MAICSNASLPEERAMQGPAPAQLLHCYKQQATPGGSTPATYHYTSEGSPSSMGGTSVETYLQEGLRRNPSKYETADGHIPQHLVETKSVAPSTVSSNKQSEIPSHAPYTIQRQLQNQESPKQAAHLCARHTAENIKQANPYRPVTRMSLELPNGLTASVESLPEQGAPQCDKYYPAELALPPCGSAPRDNDPECCTCMESPCEVDRTIQVSGGQINRTEKIERMYGLVRGQVSLPCMQWSAGCSNVGRPAAHCWSVPAGLQLLPSNWTVLLMLVLCVMANVIFPSVSAEKSFHHRDMSDEPILNPVMQHFSVSDFQAASVSFIFIILILLAHIYGKFIC